MTLITTAQRQKLLENGRAQRDAIDRQDQVLDFQPVVKLFTADGNATWLLTELNPDIDLAFGLCDWVSANPSSGTSASRNSPPPAVPSGYRSSAISTSHRPLRSPPTPNAPANIAASFADPQPPAFG
jgi:Protein of unknown function (DUF2958)